MSAPQIVSRTIIPAQPGWLVLWREDYLSEVNDETGRDQIIAWEITTEEHRNTAGDLCSSITVDPITAEGRVHHEANFALIDPDGRHIITDDLTAETRDAFNMAMLERREAVRNSIGGAA